jgi:uncharacterized membrane protein
MLSQIKLFIIGLIFIIIVDGIWLKLVMGKIFQSEVGNIAKNVNIYAAILAWTLMIIGIIVFVLPKNNPLAYGALFGLVLYGVYDLSNFATLQSWTLKLLIIDVAWGVVLCSITSYAMQWISKI